MIEAISLFTLKCRRDEYNTIHLPVYSFDHFAVFIQYDAIRQIDYTNGNGVYKSVTQAHRKINGCPAVYIKYNPENMTSNFIIKTSQNVTIDIQIIKANQLDFDVEEVYAFGDKRLSEFKEDLIDSLLDEVAQRLLEARNG